MSATSGPPSPSPAAVPPAEAFAVMGGSSVSHSLPGVGPPASTSSSRVVSSEGEEGNNSGSESEENPFASSPEKSGGGGENGGGGGGAAGDLSPRWGPAAAEEAGAAAQPPQQQQPQAMAPPNNNPGGNPGIRGVHRHHHQQHHGFGPTLYARPEDSASHITVSDPVTQTEGMNKKYISYRVECHPRRRSDGDTGAPNENAQLPVSAASDVHSAVHRRYNDFHWLSAQLRRERPGAVVPPIPEKQAVSRFDPEFVEERRAGLEKFLRRVAVHAELMDAECLGTFLRSDDLTFQAAKKKGSGGGVGGGAGQREGALSPDHQINIAPLANNASSVVAATVPAEPKKKNKLKNWFQETTTALSRDLVASPDDHLFDEIGRYVDDLEKAVKKCHHEAERLVKKRRDENGMYIELGKALSQLSGAADGTGADSASAGTLAAGVGLGRPAAVVADASSSSLAPLCQDAAEAELTKFLDPLGDHLRTVQSVRSALQQRQNRRLTYTTSLNTVTTKNAQMMKLRGQTNPNSAGSQMKLYDAELSLSRAQQAAESSRIEYEAVSGRVLREVDRFKAEGAKNVRATLAEYCAAQAEFHRRMEGAWGELVPRLGEIDLDAHVPTTAASAAGGAGAGAGAGATAMGGSVGVGVAGPAGAATGAVPPIAAGNGGAPPGSHAAPLAQHGESAAAYVPTGMAAALHPGLGAHPLTQHSNGGIGIGGAGGATTTVVGGMQYRDTTGIDWSS